MTNRRAFLLGLGATLAAPAVVRADNIMRIAAPRLIVLPVAGTILPFVQPNGFVVYKMFTGSEWLLARGQALLRMHYPELGKALTGKDGHIAEAFRMPDLRGRLYDILEEPK